MAICAAIEAAACFDDQVLVERFIDGQEISVAILGDRPLGAAHDTAAQIERRVRSEAPALHEVVVHTEPA